MAHYVRFRKAAPFKPALAVIYNETGSDPAQWLDVAPIFVRSAQWIADIRRARAETAIVADSFRNATFAEGANARCVVVSVTA